MYGVILDQTDFMTSPILQNSLSVPMGTYKIQIFIFMKIPTVKWMLKV